MIDHRDLSMNARSAGRRFFCRNGRSIWTPVACGTCGNARPADTSSRRSSASLNCDLCNFLSRSIASIRTRRARRTPGWRAFAMRSHGIWWHGAWWASLAKPTVQRPQHPLEANSGPGSAPDQSTNEPRGSLATTAVTSVTATSVAASPASVLTRGAAGICSTVAC